jgi:hypothetical protein
MAQLATYRGGDVVDAEFRRVDTEQRTLSRPLPQVPGLTWAPMPPSWATRFMSAMPDERTLARAELSTVATVLLANSGQVSNAALMQAAAVDITNTFGCVPTGVAVCALTPSFMAVEFEAQTVVPGFTPGVWKRMAQRIADHTFVDPYALVPVWPASTPDVFGWLTQLEAGIAMILERKFDMAVGQFQSCARYFPQVPLTERLLMQTVAAANVMSAVQESHKSPRR